MSSSIDLSRRDVLRALGPDRFDPPRCVALTPGVDPVAVAEVPDVVREIQVRERIRARDPGDQDPAVDDALVLHVGAQRRQILFVVLGSPRAELLEPDRLPYLEELAISDNNRLTLDSRVIEHPARNQDSILRVEHHLVTEAEAHEADHP